MEKRDFKENTGVLFKNEKRKTENHPGYTGHINVNGQEYWLSAWVKEGKSGKYFGLAISPKEPLEKTSERSKVTNFDDEDLPF